MRKKVILITLIILIAVVLTTAICFWLLKINNIKIFTKPEAKTPQSTKILFVGDLMFDRGIRYVAEKNKSNKFIFAKIEKILQSTNLVVANLEGTITNNKSISLGTVPGSTKNYFFTFDPSVPVTLFNENIRIVNLGNNHILNFEKDGLEQTKKYLEQAQIGYFGAPGSQKTITTEINGIKIAFVSYDQFANFSLTENVAAVQNEIKNAKNNADIIFVYCHWGIEYKKTPGEEQIRLAHQFIDAGADAVIGSHPHVTQTVEEYNGKRIYYSLGNFVFDQYFSEDVRNGMGVIISIDKNTKQLSFQEKNFYLDINGQTIEKIEQK